MKETSNWIPFEKFQEILAAIPRLKIRKWLDEDVQMLFKITYWIALRIGESLRLSVDDFDLQLGIVYLGKTKTNKNDSRVIPKTFVPELQSYLKDKNGALFPGMNYPIVYQWIIRLGKMCNVKAWLTPESETGEKTKTHGFRKSRGKDMHYGTLIGYGAPISTVSMRLGHKGKNKEIQTMQYLKLGNEGVRDYDKLEADILSKEKTVESK